MQDLFRLFLAYEMLPEMASSLCTIGFLRQAMEAMVGTRDIFCSRVYSRGE
jgi:hypothetical protein